jgi:probable HAF family extracellular repeat protein
MFGHPLSRFARVLFLALVALAPLNALPVGASGTDALGIPTYRVTDLGTLGGTWSIAYGLNDRGQVVGIANVAGDANWHGFLWQNGVMTDLGTLGGGNSYAIGISASSVVTGGSETTDPNGDDFCTNGIVGTTAVCHTFNWKNGVMTDLGTLGGLNSGSNAINDRQQISAQSEITATDPNFGFPEAHAALYQRGTIHDLGAIGGPLSWGNGINNRGELTGASSLSFDVDPTIGWYDFHAVLFDHGTIQDLGTLGGTFSNGIGINQGGQVTGYSLTANDAASVPFIWQDGTMTAINPVAGDSVGTGWGISDSGQVVGSSGPITAPVHAFIWSHGATTDLNTRIPANSGWQLTWATGINARGQIVGQGIIGGQYHAFLLTPSSSGEAAIELGTTVSAASVLAHVPAPTESERRLLAWWQSGFGMKRGR